MHSAAKVRIDSKHIKAFLWEMSVGVDKTTVKISCYQHNGPGLSLPKEGVVPVEKTKHDLVLTDSLGTPIRVPAELTRIESHEKIGEVPTVDYFFDLKKSEEIYVQDGLGGSECQTLHTD